MGRRPRYSSLVFLCTRPSLDWTDENPGELQSKEAKKKVSKEEIPGPNTEKSSY